MYYILELDKKHFVYMRDLNDDHLLFAVRMDVHDSFRDTMHLYESDADGVPDDYTMEVMTMTEISTDVYSMAGSKPLRYPVNHLDYVHAFPAQGTALHA
jgi:hypothetical protein